MDARRWSGCREDNGIRVGVRTAGVRHSQSTGDSVRVLHVTVPGRKTAGHSGPVSTWKPTSPDCITVLFYACCDALFVSGRSLCMRNPQSISLRLRFLDHLVSLVEQGYVNISEQRPAVQT